MISLAKIDDRIAQWSKVLSMIGLIGLLCLSLITVGAVLLRAIFGISILGIYDASALIVVVVVAACFPLASAERGQIAVKVLGPKLGRRPNHLFETFSALVSSFFFLFLTIQLWKYVVELFTRYETTWIVHIPMFPWWVAGATMISLCIPIELLCLVRSLRGFFRPDEN